MRKKRTYYRDTNKTDHFRDTCVYCGFPAECLDHIVPATQGGRSTINNLVASCNECNLVASDKVFDTLDEKREYILSIIRPRRNLRQCTCPMSAREHLRACPWFIED